MTDDPKEQPSKKLCFDCGIQAPATETDYTLISSRFGWRLRRGFGPNGVPFLEWRCPKCWEQYKKFHNATTPPQGTEIIPPSSPKKR
jgi:hypothetical protein